MIRYLLTLLLAGSLCCAFAARPRHQYIRIRTAQGECILLLYNATPKHRDNMVSLVKKGFYDGTLFHRVIASFMVQGGDPDSRHAAPGTELGNGDLGYTLPAEFSDSLFHRKGALGAARDDNPAMASSACQFYIVQGKTFSADQLDSLEKNRLHYRLPQQQREVYQHTGGSPHLDRKYTVYGQVVSGIEMIDSLASAATDERNRPLKDIPMTVSLLKRKEARRLEKRLGLADKP